MRDISPIPENHMEKKVEHELETGVGQVFLRAVPAHNYTLAQPLERFWVLSVMQDFLINRSSKQGLSGLSGLGWSIGSEEMKIQRPL